MRLGISTKSRGTLVPYVEAKRVRPTRAWMPWPSSWKMVTRLRWRTRVGRVGVGRWMEVKRRVLG
jgi:hypothetical protein